ncbi:hypothetical protein [Microbulbifer sp. SAOS-129_SWC]|uniref:hypothetical protein n=1 Tax=Microbulbifer sp. SAOS-129_SWC TaxID=3145235 RepID=UPI0032180172
MVSSTRGVLLLFAVILTATAVQADPLPGYQSFNGITNDVGPDLATVIEYDATKAACDQYQTDLDQYLADNDAVLSQLDDNEVSMAVLSDQEQYIVDNFVNNYDEAKLLQCGKYLFFYGTFDTTGPPKSMMNFMLRNFEGYFGPGFANFGMYPDPNPVATIPPSPFDPSVGPKQLPVGIADSSGVFGSSVPVYAFTCAACHFKKMGDGNYAVGVGNTDFDYSRMVSVQGQLPMQFLFQAPNLAGYPDETAEQILAGTVLPGVQQELNYPVVMARYFQPGGIPEFLAVNQELEAGSTQEDRDRISATLLQQAQGWTAWSGVLDFMVPPMQDDGAFTITRILDLSNIVTDENVQKQYGFKYKSGLGWHGGSFDLINFVRSVITLTPSDIDNPESRAEYNYWVNEYRFMPLVRYLETFDEPNLPNDRVFDMAAAKRGEAIFDDDCSSCHNGPSGETSRPYAHAEVNVERGNQAFMNLYWDSSLFGGIGGFETNVTALRERFPAGETGIYTMALKSPRLASLWDNERLLHNGSAWGLEELLTCTSGRASHADLTELVNLKQRIDYSDPTSPPVPLEALTNTQFSNQGHQFGCEYSSDQKADLIDFVQTFATSRNVGNRYNGQWDSACEAAPGPAGKYMLNSISITKGKRMELLVKFYSDAACQVLDTSVVNNPRTIHSWAMEVGDSFVNSRGYLSHNVTYTKPDGSTDEDVIAIEGDELATATEGDPVPRGLFVKARTDYPGLNGDWLNDQCSADNTRGMVVIWDGVRVNKTVSYNAPGCTGGVSSVVNDDAWTFSDPLWMPVISPVDSAPKYNMQMVMNSQVDGSGLTQYVNVTDTTLSTASDNNFAASNRVDSEHYTRIYNIKSAK